MIEHSAEFEIDSIINMASIGIDDDFQSAFIIVWVGYGI